MCGVCIHVSSMIYLSIVIQRASGSGTVVSNGFHVTRICLILSTASANDGCNSLMKWFTFSLGEYGGLA